MLSPKDVLTHDSSALFPILILIVIGIAALVLKGLIHLPSGRKAGEFRGAISIVRHQILTMNETAFFRSLQTAVGQQYLIFPQLSLQTFLQGRAQNATAQVSFTNKIDRKRVDFVLVDPQDLRVHLAIELDDRSHEAEHRRRRDGFVESVLQQAGIRLVRIPAARSYAVSTLRQQLGLLDAQSEARQTSASF